MKTMFRAGLVLLLSSLMAWAEEERLSVAVGSVETIELPAAMETYKMTPRDKIGVEEITKQQLRILGKSVGECNLAVTCGGVVIDYLITVRGNISVTLKRLRTDLGDLPELDLSINQDYIVIRGTVSNPAHWSLLQKVLPIYGKSVHNFAIFQPNAETLLNLKKMLIEGGCEFAADGEELKPGQISMKLAPDALIITGEMWSQEGIDKVKQILSTQSWLSLGDEQPDPSSGKIRGLVNLGIVNEILEVDVVYVAISEADADKEGSQAPTATFGAKYLFDFVSGRKAEGSSVTFGSNINQTVSFLASNGISRAYNAGHVSFASHDEKGGSLHTGGKVRVKVSGVENGSLQDIDFGLQISIKGGLISANKVKLDLDLSNNSVVTSTGDSYTQSTDSTQQTVYCELNKTLAIAGSRKIAQDVSRSGLPILRSTPVLKWFVSGEAESKSENRLLVLVCPRRASASESTQIEIPVSDETAGTYKDAQEDLAEKEKAKRKKYTGWKAWMNWFQW
jgi:Flp pilus assembly secretin CpaC